MGENGIAKEDRDLFKSAEVGGYVRTQFYPNVFPPLLIGWINRNREIWITDQDGNKTLNPIAGIWETYQFDFVRFVDAHQRMLWRRVK